MPTPTLALAAYAWVQGSGIAPVEPKVQYLARFTGFCGMGVVGRVGVRGADPVAPQRGYLGAYGSRTPCHAYTLSASKNKETGAAQASQAPSRVPTARTGGQRAYPPLKKGDGVAGARRYLAQVVRAISSPIFLSLARAV